MAISIGQTPLVVQLASLVGWVKFPNWLILFTNVSPGSLKVSTGHIAVHTQVCDKGYAQGGIITMHLLWAPAFTRLRRLGPNTSLVKRESKTYVECFLVEVVFCVKHHQRNVYNLLYIFVDEFFSLPKEINSFSSAFFSNIRSYSANNAPLGIRLYFKKEKIKWDSVTHKKWLLMSCSFQTKSCTKAGLIFSPSSVEMQNDAF